MTGNLPASPSTQRFHALFSSALLFTCPQCHASKQFGTCSLCACSDQHKQAGSVKHASTNLTKQSACRATCMKGSPAAFAAPNATRLNDTGLAAFLGDYALGGLEDTGKTRIWNLPFSSLINGTLDGWLLEHWFQDLEIYDGLFLNALANSSAVSCGFFRPGFLLLLRCRIPMTLQIPQIAASILPCSMWTECLKR